MSSHPVQILAPTGRDASLMATFLSGAGVSARVQGSATLSESERDHMGALLIAEEALLPSTVQHLSGLLREQPAWSDLPVIVLTSGGMETAQSLERQQSRLSLGQFSLLERPVRPGTLLSTVQASLRARDRQFEVRDAMLQRDGALAALTRSEERLRMAAETAHLGIWEIALPGWQLTSSEICKQQFGLAPQQTFTLGDFEASVDAADRDRVRAALARTAADGSAYRVEYKITWPDATPHWIIASGHLQVSPEGEPTGITGVTLDVTERHLAMQTLLRNEKLAAVGRLASSIAHEINNPLESVTNLLFLARQSATEPSAIEYLDLAERELRRVSRITNQTLRFHKQQTAAKSVPLDTLFADALSIHQGRLVNSSVQVEQRIRKTQPVLCFDGEIRQVLNNLLGNAIDAMGREGGRLFLRLRQGTEWTSGQRGVFLTVADTGSGIAPQNLRSIFDAFFSTKGIGGTGLGLWISQEIISRHHGRTLVRSCAVPGRSGTVFSVFLPQDCPPDRQ